MNSVTYIGIKTLMRKEVTRIVRIWTQTLLPPAITMTLYFVIFGNLIGSRIGQMGGFDYMSFIVPGLVMMAVITSSYGNMVSSFFGAKFAKHVEELLVSPMPSWAILAGYVSGSLFRGLSVGLIVTIISLFFTDIQVHNIWIIISTVILTSIVFSLGGFINAAFAKKFDDIAIIPTFVLTPLTYLGGVFYSISLLPDFWQKVSLINPVLYMVNTFRYGFLGVSDINVGVAYGIIIAFVLILGFISWYILHKGIGLRS
ncbi:MAG: ABC transporter permease [Marinicella sp.]